jgi:hypothetical protein
MIYRWKTKLCVLIVYEILYCFKLISNILIGFFVNFTIFVQYFVRGFLNIYSYTSIGLLRKLRKIFSSMFFEILYILKLV